MFNDDFLKLYNEELFYLREVGRHFAIENPQVAKYLGMHKDAIVDPFVERLLEGTAFLTARVQQRLNYEQPEFALQMLSRIAPLWYTPIPSIAMVSMTPDLTYPQWYEKTYLPRGSKVLLSDPSLNNKTVTFTTARDIKMQPVEIENVECVVMPPKRLPQSVLSWLQGGQALICFQLSTKKVCTVAELDLNPIRLTFTSDAIRSNQLLSLLLNQSLRVVLWSKTQGEPIIHVMSPEDICLDGIDEDESLLPSAIGELPGNRLLREYFHAPFRFYGVQLRNCEQFLKQCAYASEFEIIFSLKQRPLQLIEQLSAADFRLFSTPIVNLYRRRCHPIFLEHDKTEHPIIVDRLQPTLYQIHHLIDVKGIVKEGAVINFSPLQSQACFDDIHEQAGYSIRRKKSPLHEKRYRNSRLPYDDIFMTLSPGETKVDMDKVQSLSVDAMVCERHLIPEHLQQPELQLEMALPIHQIELVRYPTDPSGVPEISHAWQVLQALSNNPLRYARPKFDDCTAIIHDWLTLFANSKNPAHIKCITSIKSASIEHCYERYQGIGPIAWTRGAALKIDLQAAHHADHGEFLFGKILLHALADFCDLNQTLRMELTVDGHDYACWGAIG